MFGLGEVRVYVLDDLLRRLGKDCEVCVYGPAKRRFLTNECCKCIERAEKLVHSVIPDPNYIDNAEKLDKWLKTDYTINKGRHDVGRELLIRNY